MPTFKHHVAPHSRIDIRDKGALGANTIDNAAFATAAREARDSKRSVWPGLINDPPGSRTIHLPAGDYRITDLNGLLGVEAMQTKGRGIRFVGAGSDLTHVHFAPEVAGALITNTLWNNIGFEGITFTTGTAGSTFMHTISENSAAVQEYTFTDVKWFGPWKYGINLQGTNNNSEYRFFGCATSGMADDGAFLYIGATNTSDQFLNYWFYGFKHWSTSAALIDAAKGGHFHLFGVDASAWGTNLTAPGYLLRLKGNVHAQGTLSMSAHALRVEAKSPFAGLLYSEWPDGNVAIQCDWSSQTIYHTYGDIIHMNLGNSQGPILSIHDSHLAGGVKVQYGSSAHRFYSRLLFERCVWRQKLTPSEVVTYDESGSGGANARPAVEFRDCRGEQQEARDLTKGLAVWDATIGYRRGPLVKPVAKRSLVTQGVYGSPAGSDKIRIHLPVGALVTGMTAVAPANSRGDTDGATWHLHTSEATPVLVSEVAVTTHLGTGYAVESKLPIPFHCNTREKATVDVTVTGTTQASYDAFVTVEGYW